MTNYNMTNINTLRTNIGRALGVAYGEGYYFDGTPEQAYFRAIHRIAEPIMTTYAYGETHSAREHVIYMREQEVKYDGGNEYIVRACDDLLRIIEETDEELRA